MNKKIIIILMVILSLGGISSVLIIRFRSKNQDSLEVKEEEKKEEKIIKPEHQQKDKETDTPWLLTWKGELLSTTIIGFLIVVIIILLVLFLMPNIQIQISFSGFFDKKNYKSVIKKIALDFYRMIAAILCCFIFAISDFIIAPLILSRKYHRRFRDAIHTSKKVVNISNIIIFTFNVIIFFYRYYKTGASFHWQPNKPNNNSKNNVKYISFQKSEFFFNK